MVEPHPFKFLSILKVLILNPALGELRFQTFLQRGLDKREVAATGRFLKERVFVLCSCVRMHLWVHTSPCHHQSTCTCLFLPSLSPFPSRKILLSVHAPTAAASSHTSAWYLHVNWSILCQIFPGRHPQTNESTSAVLSATNQQLQPLLTGKTIPSWISCAIWGPTGKVNYQHRNCSTGQATCHQTRLF